MLPVLSKTFLWRLRRCAGCGTHGEHNIVYSEFAPARVKISTLHATVTPLHARPRFRVARIACSATCIYVYILRGAKLLLCGLASVGEDPRAPCRRPRPEEVGPAAAHLNFSQSRMTERKTSLTDATSLGSLSHAAGAASSACNRESHTSGRAVRACFAPRAEPRDNRRRSSQRVVVFSLYVTFRLINFVP